MATTDTRARNQAKAELESISEMVVALNSEDDDAREVAVKEIHEDPLSVEVRSGWTTPGQNMEPAEYCILLCTGGPAVRIIGDLDEYTEPAIFARLEYQDWETPWTPYPLSSDEEETLVSYAQQFYFGS